MPRLHVLGSGGWVPTPQRLTCSYLLETRRSLIFFDCGTGLSRLHDPALQMLLARHTRALVLLSHYHHDHLDGLAYIPFFLREHEVVLAAPAGSITGHDPERTLATFGGKPFLPHPLETWGERFPRGFSIQGLEPGSNVVLGEDVEVIVQPHSDPSVGFRVRDVCYVTDTSERAETSGFARGAALLVHDAWLDGQGAAEEPEELAAHATAAGAARVAEAAGVRELLLAHLNPSYDPMRLDLLLFEAAGIFKRTLLGTDMMVTDVRVPGEEEPAMVSEAMEDGEETDGDGLDPGPDESAAERPWDAPATG